MPTAMTGVALRGPKGDTGNAGDLNTTNQAGVGATQRGTTSSTLTLKAHTHTVTPTGTNTPGAATSVVQPYFVCYFWQRAGMTFWLRILAYVAVWLIGQSLNVWQVTKYGFMPMTFPWGDWIPIASRWLFSIGDVLQLFGIVAIILATLLRVSDERYMRRSM